MNGRNVACIRSKEIAARFVTDANGMKRNQTFITTDARLEELIDFHRLQLLPINEHSKTAQPATNISATAKLITRYMQCLRRLRSFRQTMIVRPFNTTMATAAKPYAVSQAMHSGAENNTKDEVVFCC